MSQTLCTLLDLIHNLDLPITRLCCTCCTLVSPSRLFTALLVLGVDTSFSFDPTPYHSSVAIVQWFHHLATLSG